jgi:hypothetical protein
MFAWIKSIATAGNKLARALTALAESVEEVNEGLRQQVGLDAPARGRKPRGEVLENKPAAGGNGAPAA